MGKMGRIEMSVKDEYDTSWDLVESKKGNLPKSEEAWDKKYQEWMKRDWMKWLRDNLSFPVAVKRVDDEDDAYFTDVAKYELFRLGHKMEVLSLETEIPRYGIIVKVREKGQIGSVPLNDLKVTSKKDPNYWPVNEYVVWDANH